MAASGIRSFRREDTEAVVALWRDAGLVVPWNDPYRDIERKLAVQPELFLVVESGDADRSIIGAAVVGYDGHRRWVNCLDQAVSLGKRLIPDAAPIPDAPPSAP